MGNELTSVVSPMDIPVVPWLDARTSTLVCSITTLLAQQHPEVHAIILFGSIARHDERPLDDPQPSDVDLLILVDERLPERKAFEIVGTIGEAGDPYGFTPREVKTLLVRRDLADWDPLFIENVARDGILLWARGPLPPPLAAIAERTRLTPRQPHRRHKNIRDARSEHP